MRWFSMFRRHSQPEPTEQEKRLTREVDALDARTKRAVKDANAVLNAEMRQVYETIVGDRRHLNTGRTPERRNH